MKRILFIIWSLIFPVVAFAIEYNIGSYINATNGKSYAVDVRLKKDKIDYVYIYMTTQTGVTGYFNFKGKDLQDFYNVLCEMRNKYCEWSDTAANNGVVTFSKDFGYLLPKGNLFWLGTETWMASNKRLTPMFMVVNAKPMFMLIEKTEAMQNKYVTETFSLVFTDLTAYDNFTQIFNPESALKKAIENQNLIEKFK